MTKAKESATANASAVATMEPADISNTYGQRGLIALADDCFLDSASPDDKGASAWVAITGRGFTVRTRAPFGEGPGMHSMPALKATVRECQTGKRLQVVMGCRIGNGRFGPVGEFTSLAAVTPMAELAGNTLRERFGAIGLVLMADGVAVEGVREREEDPTIYRLELVGLGFTSSVECDISVMPLARAREVHAACQKGATCSVVMRGRISQGKFGPVVEAKSLLAMWGL